MTPDVVFEMVAVSTAVSGAMVFVVTLMVRASIAEAANKITAELHAAIGSHYASKDLVEGISLRITRLEERG
jgi:Na+-translocating ferredoxin:NAD+ oxidoreductase RnfG subunit